MYYITPELYRAEDLKIKNKFIKLNEIYLDTHRAIRFLSYSR